MEGSGEFEPSSRGVPSALAPCAPRRSPSGGGAVQLLDNPVRSLDLTAPRMETLKNVATRAFELVLDAEEPRVIRGRLEWPRESAGPSPLVVIVHGFKGFMDWGFFPELSRRIAAAGLCAVSFNMSGSGIGPELDVFSDDEGFRRNSMSRELEDLAAVVEFASRQPEVDATRRALVGHSFGGGLALIHAAETRGWNAVVVWAGVATLDRFGPRAKALWRELGELAIPNARTGQVHRIGLDWLDDLEANLQGRFDVLAAAGRLETPVWLLHARDDETAGFHEAEQLADALSGCHLIAFERAGHTFGARHPLEAVGHDLERALGVTIEALADSLRLGEQEPDRRV